MASRDFTQERRRCLTTLLLLCLFVGLAASCPAQLAAAGPSSSPDARFTLNGTVVNSATGEPIARALVRLSGAVQRTVFSDEDGRFQIDGLPPGQVELSAQRPGYFSPRQTGPHMSAQLVNIGSNAPAVVVKLTPQGAIYGRVIDSAGEPIANVPVRLTGRDIRAGHMRWNSAGYTQTDEDGRFRMANLMPGTYYLAAGPATEDNRVLPVNTGPKVGYTASYYPGVPDLASASPIQLAPGRQMQADLSLTASPLFHVKGTVTGYPEGQGFNLQFYTRGGDGVPFPVPYDPGLGTFHADRVPAGSYQVRASAQRGAQSLVGETSVNVAADIDNLHIALAPAISIPVTVTFESRAARSQSASPDKRTRPFLPVCLIPAEPNGTEGCAAKTPGNVLYAEELQRVDPGRYALYFNPIPPWYVQSARYGQTNLLSDPLVVVAGQAFPIEVVLRDDSATLTGELKSADATKTAAIVVAVSRLQANSPFMTRATADSGFTISGLAPGDYLVYAFDDAEDIEYSNPEALRPYASQAAPVTLAPNQSTKVTLNLIHTGDAE